MKIMKTIRLLYPDHLSGGLDTYYFGANLLAHILPATRISLYCGSKSHRPMEKRGR